MIRVLAVDTGLDLRPLLSVLYRQGIRHKVTEESGKQVIWAGSEQEAAVIASLMEQWERSGYAAIPVEEGARPRPMFSATALGNGLLGSFWRAPVTTALIAACLLVALLSRLGAEPEAVWYLFYPVLSAGGAASIGSVLAGIDSAAEAVRTLTPAFLHFGAVHLVFNSLWLWYLGGMIEGLQSSRRYLLLVIVTAFVSNTTQYLSSYSINFGGMSGVVYGLIGYIWIWQFQFPQTRLRLQPAMIFFFLVALVVMEVLASSWIATGAHVGGLVAGMVVATILGFYHRMRGGQA